MRGMRCFIVRPSLVGMLSSMLRPMLTLLCPLAVLGATGAPAKAATRVAEARIERVDTAAATLHQVQVRLAWAPREDSGDLTLRAGSGAAPDLGYRSRGLQAAR